MYRDITPIIKPLHGTEQALRTAAIAACSQQTSPLAASIQQVIAESSDTHRQTPIHIGSSSNSLWSSWHYGDQFTSYAIGGTDVLDACRLTDNERERLLLALRRAESHGEQFFIVAKLSGAHPLHILPTHQLECLGTIEWRPSYS